jgi:hypothetical protein
MMMMRTRMVELYALILVEVEEVEKVLWETEMKEVQVDLVALVMPTWIIFLP